jgi:hypothetical protein
MPNNIKPFDYSSPSPFALPTIQTQEATTFTGALSFLNSLLPVTLLPREGLSYSAQVFEEAMTNITDEFDKRGLTKPQWRSYKAHATKSKKYTTKATFENPTAEGLNLRDQPIEVVPLIVQQIQDEIERLIEDPEYPDDLEGYFARIFANNTIINSRPWDNVNKLSTSAIILTTSGVQTINPQGNASSGVWPFSAELMGRMVSQMGVFTTDPTRQNIGISKTGEAGKVEVTDPNFPQSPYASTPPGTTEDFQFTASNRTVFNRINVSNSSQGVGAGKVDPDMGYGYVMGVPPMIEQLRFQPPMVENFPFPKAVQDYASAKFSNTTPNLPWVLSLPIERQIQQNWGFWLIKGQAGVVNGRASLRAYNNPSASDGGRGQCPFSVFFPPPVANCSCSTGDSAFFIWHAAGSGFTIDDLNLIQVGSATPRQFGRNTRLQVGATVTGGAAGTGTLQAFFGVGIRTARITNVNLQPLLL